MSEIIWAMNSRYDTASDLTGYIRRYASEYLEEHNKTLKFSSAGITHELAMSGEKRRNLFLVTKEILHNYIKYADSNELQITVSMNDNILTIEFLEIGNTGFDWEVAVDKGNGLFNINNRMKNIGGFISQEQSKLGYSTTLTYPYQ